MDKLKRLLFDWILPFAITGIEFTKCLNDNGVLVFRCSKPTSKQEIASFTHEINKLVPNKVIVLNDGVDLIDVLDKEMFSNALNEAKN